MCVELSGGRQTRISKQLLDSQSSPRRLQIFPEMINPPTTLLNSHPDLTTRTSVLFTYPTVYLTCRANGWQPVTVNSTPFWSSASKPSAGIPVARAAERVTHRGEVRGFGTGMFLHSLKSWLQPNKKLQILWEDLQHINQEISKNLPYLLYTSCFSFWSLGTWRCAADVIMVLGNTGSAAATIDSVGSTFVCPGWWARV